MEYEVEVSIQGYRSFIVNAKNADEAKDRALAMAWRYSNLRDTECHATNVWDEDGNEIESC